MRILIGQDGDAANIDNKILRHLDDGDVKYNKEIGSYVFDFVGLVFSNDEVLAVFPKHYFSLERLREEQNDPTDNILYDVKLLFNTINRYISLEASSAKAIKYIGHMKEYDSDYPFDAFYNIYDYYRKYGVYSEENQLIEKNGNGQIIWKKTIENSNLIISNHQFIYLPVFTKKKKANNVLITECMIFAINYTLNKFSDFLDIKPIYSNTKKFDFISNRKFIIKKLYQYKNRIFKDIDRNLLDNLILFFETLDKNAHGGNYHVKINYFNNIWQSMVNNYLNTYFDRVDSDNNQIIFDINRKESSVFFDKKSFIIDDSIHHYSIELDHYAKNRHKQYIFDSKYYENMSSLDYKQLCYDSLVDYYYKNDDIQTFSALLIPGDSRNKEHLKLKKEFGLLHNNQHIIIEQYINVKTVMETYL